MPGVDDEPVDIVGVSQHRATEQDLVWSQRDLGFVLGVVRAVKVVEAVVGPFALDVSLEASDLREPLRRV